MYAPFFQVLWLVTFVVLLRDAHGARTLSPGEAPLPRHFLRPVLTAFALGLLAATGWGWIPAVEGFQNARRALRGTGADAPVSSFAQVSLVLREVQLRLEPDGPGWRGTIGPARDAALRFPASTRLPDGPSSLVALRVAPGGTPEVTPLAATSATRVLVVPAAAPTDRGTEIGAASSRALLKGECRAVVAGDASSAGSAPTSVYVFFCAGKDPRAALQIDSARPDGDLGKPLMLIVRPFHWTGAGWQQPSLEVNRGELIQLGGLDGTVPGLRVWDVPGPPGQVQAIFPPADLLDARAWLEGRTDARRQQTFAGRALPLEQPDEEAFALSTALVLPVTPPFGLDVRFRVPTPNVCAPRAFRASLVLMLPLLLSAVLVSFGARDRYRHRFAQLYGLAAAVAAISLVLQMKLSWAYRIDAVQSTSVNFANLAGPLVHGVEALTWQASLLLATLAVLTFSWPWKRWSAAGIELAERYGWTLLTLGALASAILAAIISKKADALRGTWLHGNKMPFLVAAWGSVASLALLPSPLPLVLASWRYLLLPATLAVLLKADTGVAAMFTLAALPAALLLRRRDWLVRNGLGSNADRGIFTGLGSGAIAALVGLLVVTTSHGDGDPALPRLFTLLVAAGVAVVVFVSLAGAILNLRCSRRLISLRFVVLAAGAACALFLWTGLGRRLETFVVSRSTSHTWALRIAAIVDPAEAFLFQPQQVGDSLTSWNAARLEPPPAATNRAPPSSWLGEGYFGATIRDRGVRKSLDNDYLPILVLRDTGVLGMFLTTLALLLCAVGILASRGPESEGNLTLRRARTLFALTWMLLGVYLPLASLGVLPFTGISWPGLGIRGATDSWITIGLILFGYMTFQGSRASRQPTGLGPEESAPLPARVVVAGLVTAALVAAGARFASVRQPFVEARPDGGTVYRSPVGVERVRRLVKWIEPVRCWSPQTPVDAGRKETMLPQLGFDPTGDPAWKGEAPFDAFQKGMKEEWGDDTWPVARVREFLTGACSQAKAGPWRATGDASCNKLTLTFSYGWPDVKVTYERKGRDVLMECQVTFDQEKANAFLPATPLSLPPGPVRLVGKPMGIAAHDVGEVLANDVVARVDASDATVDLRSDAPGMYRGGRLRLPGAIEITGTSDPHAPLRVARVGRQPVADARPPALLSRARTQPPAPRLDGSAPEAGEINLWEVRPLDDNRPVSIDTLSVLIIPEASGSVTWLLRPASPGGGIPTLLADDVSGVDHTRSEQPSADRSRRYVYGSLLPELGWWQEGTLPAGLDGLVHKALHHSKPSVEPELRPNSYAKFVGNFCGTLAPPLPSAPAPCAPSELDRKPECMVALQPTLEIRLRHALELIGRRPGAVPGDKREKRPPLVHEAQFALVRGDTGEIVAQGEFVPGREGTAYAPRTAEERRRLDDLRTAEERRRLSHLGGNRASALKFQWPSPIPVGSTLKPLVAEAVMRTDESFARHVRLVGDPRRQPATCGTAEHFAPLFGHCPATKSIWLEHDPRRPLQSPVEMGEYLASSLNWYQGSLGLLAPALGGGGIRFGANTAPLPPSGAFGKNVALPTEPMSVAGASGELVLDGDRLDLGALARTPFWSRFEALVGRRTCREKCNDPRQQWAQQWLDMCAVRALPVADIPGDWRSLASAGPGDFDLSVESHHRLVFTAREYLQFLRGSGNHRLGSLLQLADAYNRLFFDQPDADGRYHTAATWFAAAGAPPTFAWPAECGAASVQADPVRRGLCNVIETNKGTAFSVRSELHVPGLTLYGAKTGTIDSLGESAACKLENDSHVLLDCPDQPGGRCPDQPYQLRCGDDKVPSDSLFVIAFRAGSVPLTLALRFQAAGMGAAAHVAPVFLREIAAYFAD